MKMTVKPSDIFMAIPPGETVAAELNARGQTIEDLVAAMELDTAKAKKLLTGEIAIDVELASGLGEFFGSPAAFWQRLEAQYREAVAAGKPTELAPRNPAGNIALRVPRSLHQRIRRLAAIEGVSMNHCLLAIVAEGVARHEMQNL